MSAPENQDSRGRLLTYLFWGGIGLAPLAALLLIVAGSSTSGLRVAAILAIFAVMAIGISITLRRDAAAVKVELEEAMLDEIDMLRGDVRADITTAARATHRALSDKVAHLHESLEQVRRQVESGPALEVDRMARPVVGPPPGMRAVAAVPSNQVAPGGPGVVQRTETVRVTTRTIVDPDEEPHPRNYHDRPVIESAGRGVDPRDDRPVRARRMRSEPEDDDAPPAGYRSEGHRRDPRSREIAPSRPSDFEVAARQGWSDTSSDDLANDPRWSGMRAGDRWAEVRQDERGREVRMGERRAHIRTDETGTHLRVVDRWSTIREDHGHVEPGETFENTGETRAERRARQASETEGDRPAPNQQRELPSGESRAQRRQADDEESRSRRSRAIDDYQSLHPRPLESGRSGDRDDRESWDEPSRHGESRARRRRAAAEDRAREDSRARDAERDRDDRESVDRDRDYRNADDRDRGYQDHGYQDHGYQDRGYQDHGYQDHDYQGRDYRSGDEPRGRDAAAVRGQDEPRRRGRDDSDWTPRAARGAEGSDHEAGSRSRDDVSRSRDNDSRSRDAVVELVPAQRRPARPEQVDHNPVSDPWAFQEHHGHTPERDGGWRDDERRSSDWRADDRRAEASRDGERHRGDRGDAWQPDRRERVDEWGPQRRDDRAPREDRVSQESWESSDDRWNDRANHHDERSDDRWEREPSVRSRARPRQYDFEVNDERWH